MSTTKEKTPKHAGYQYTKEIEAYDRDYYDTDAMLTDAKHGNFSPDHAEDYRHEAIVQASILNGQFTQARNQCAAYRLDYDEQKRAAKSL